MNVPTFLKGFLLRWWEGVECYSDGAVAWQSQGSRCFLSRCCSDPRLFLTLCGRGRDRRISTMYTS